MPARFGRWSSSRPRLSRADSLIQLVLTIKQPGCNLVARCGRGRSELRRRGDVEHCRRRAVQRTDFLEDVPVADTVLVLQVLAAQRAMSVDLPVSPLLP
jgi:hypothetical protein